MTAQQLRRAAAVARAAVEVGTAVASGGSTLWVRIGAAAGATVAAGIAVLLVAALAVVTISGQDRAQAAPGGFSPLALADIPPDYLALYQAAADSCPGYPAPLLAAIGRVESNHGRGWPPLGPDTPGLRRGTNPAGAAGPMQIGVGGRAGPTFQAYAVDADGGGADVYNPADAIHTAAKIECAWWDHTGAGLSRAVYAYNHGPGAAATADDDYLQAVWDWFQQYTAVVVAGDPGAAAETAVRWALSQLGQPYLWGGTGRGGFDCSGLTMMAYRQAGIALPRVSRDQYGFGVARGLLVAAGPQPPAAWVAVLQPGDLVFFAYRLSDPSTIHHVALYVGGGQMVEAPRRGATVRVAPLRTSDLIGATRPALLGGQGAGG